MLTSQELFAIGFVREQGYSAFAIPIDSLEAHWMPGRRLSDDSESELRVTLTRDWEAATILPLVVPHREVRQRSGTSLELCDCTQFAPSWLRDNSTTILAVCFFGDNHLSYHISLKQSDRVKSQKLKAPEIVLKLISSSLSKFSQFPQRPHGLTNKGYMYSFDNHLRRFSLFSGPQTQPVSTSPLASELETWTNVWIWPTIVVDPWSGAIALHMMGLVKVVYFD